MIVAVAAVVLLLAPRGDDEGAADPAADATQAPVGPVPTSSVAPSEEAWCEGYRMLAAAQGQYVAQPDARGAELLQEEADDLVELGVPDSMSVLARTGFYQEIGGVYRSLGQDLGPEAVPGALVEEEAGTSTSSVAADFGAWLSDLCPAY